MAVRMGATIERIAQQDRLRTKIAEIAEEYTPCADNMVDRVQCALAKKHDFEKKRAKKGL
jgi:hypothetical protein